MDKGINVVDWYVWAIVAVFLLQAFFTNKIYNYQVSCFVGETPRHFSYSTESSGVEWEHLRSHIYQTEASDGEGVTIINVSKSDKRVWEPIWVKVKKLFPGNHIKEA